MFDELIPRLVEAGLLLKGVLSFLRWVLGDVGDFIRFLKQWWSAL